MTRQILQTLARDFEDQTVHNIAMNFFAHASAAERYAAARPYFHPRAVQLLLNSTGQTLFSNVLDVACGTGMGAKALLEVSNFVTGVDAAPEMLEFAKRDVPQAIFLESRAEELPFADASFDLLTTFLAFHWFDGSKFLTEAARVLQVNGFLVIVQHYFLSTLEGHELFQSEMNDFYADYPQPPRNPLRLEPNASMNFGFQIITEQRWSETFSMNAEEIAAYISTQSNIIAKVEQGVDHLEVILEKIKARVQPFLHGNKGHFGFAGQLWVLQKLG